MELRVLNTNFVDQLILEVSSSLIWTERYFGFGDFEIYTPVDIFKVTKSKKDNYLTLKDSDYLMIIESREIKTLNEEGDYLLVKGRSAESILDRRIVWGQTRLYGNFQEAIYHLLCEAFIEPDDNDRLVSNFIFEESTDEAITSLTIDTQVMAENLYTVIQSLCAVRSIGFKITLTPDNKFKFKLYSGVDRSYDQTDNTCVVFSDKFNNLISSDHISNKTNMKTIALVLGPGEGAERTGAVAVAPEGAGTGLNRREMYSDGSSVSEEVDGVIITPEDFLIQLIEVGDASLVENIWYEAFHGKVDPEGTFKYGRDFGLGDIVQLANKYGDEGRARVTEFIRSQDPSGTSVYPTFSTI